MSILIHCDGPECPNRTLPITGFIIPLGWITLHGVEKDDLHFCRKECAVRFYGRKLIEVNDFEML